MSDLGELRDLVDEPSEPLPALSDLYAWYSLLKANVASEAAVDEGKNLERFLGDDPRFVSLFALQLPPSLPRKGSSTNWEGVSVDPGRVIERLERSLLAASPAVFGRVRLPMEVKANLFESPPELTLVVDDEEVFAGLQEPGFGFAFDWSDDAGTASRAFDWAEDVLPTFAPPREAEDAKVYEMYLGLLVLGYLFHRRAYERIGSDSLEKFWTEYSLERRQGSAARPSDAPSWTVRSPLVKEEEEEEVEEVSPLPPPPPRIEVLLPDEEEIARWISYVKALLQRYGAFLRDRADPDNLGKASMVAVLSDDKARLARDAKTAERGMRYVGAIAEEGYASGEEYKTLIQWHKTLREIVAWDLDSGLSSRDPFLPTTRPEETLEFQASRALDLYML